MSLAFLLFFPLTTAIYFALPSGTAADTVYVCVGLSCVVAIVMGVGLLYLFIARPDRKSDAPSGDAIHVAELLRSRRK